MKRASGIVFNGTDVPITVAAPFSDVVRSFFSFRVGIVHALLKQHANTSTCEIRSWWIVVDREVQSTSFD